MSRLWLIAACVAATLGSATVARAQSDAAGVEAPASAQSGGAVPNDDDGALTPAEPDVVVVNLPTSLRLPQFKGNFRLTHRFAGNLRNGTFGQQAGNLFGIDQGAIIGFEYRMGLPKGVQAGFYRSSFDKTIQLHGKYDAHPHRRQSERRGARPAGARQLRSRRCGHAL